MKFHVCGGLDAPDWILAEITTLGKLSTMTMEMLTMQIIQHILEDSFDYEKVLKLTSESSGTPDIKACIAALHFFVSNAARFDVNEDTLSRELQQLGLPKEHTDSLSRPYHDHKVTLQDKFLEQSLKLPVSNIDAWQVQIGKEKSVLLNLKNGGVIQQEKHSFNGLVCLSEDKFQLLLHELKLARSMMEEMS